MFSYSLDNRKELVKPNKALLKTQHKNEDRCSLRQAVQKHAALKYEAERQSKLRQKECVCFL